MIWEQRKNYGGSKFIRGHCCFWGYSEIFASPQKELCGGQLRIIQGGRLKIRGDWEKFKYEGHTKFLGGVEKIEGQGFRGACYRGVYYTKHTLCSNQLQTGQCTGNNDKGSAIIFLRGGGGSHFGKPAHNFLGIQQFQTIFSLFLFVQTIF